MIIKTTNWLRERWRLLVVILVPLILLPLPLLIRTPQARCGYSVLILSIYWISEAIPLAVTSLLPLVLFPVTGVLTAEAVAPHYGKDIIALFFGSMAFGYAVESVNLHRRIALFVLNRVGTATQWIMAGLMGATAFLSMWINNTASTSIMLPVTLAILHELSVSEDNAEPKVIGDALGTTTAIVRDDASPQVNLDQRNNNETMTTWQTIELSQSESKDEANHRTKHEHLKKGFLLGIAYSSSIGGLSSLVGTTPNIYLKGFVENTYNGTNFRVNFLNFLIFALPIGILMLIFCWMWLQLCYNRQEFLRCRRSAEAHRSQAKLKVILSSQYQALGRPKWSELIVGMLFVILIALWVTREFSPTSGWGTLFPRNYISDGTVAMLCGLLPLIVPNSNPFTRRDPWHYTPIVKWTDLAQNISWGAIILLGAGLALASAFQTSKLSESVAKVLSFVSGIPRAAAVLVIIIISGFFTEVTSNLSTATIFFPVLNSVATSAGIHPGFFILPCTLAVSLAFMLPIATPPNAIVFGSGAIRVIDMVKTGIVMNLIGFLTIFLAANTWMPKIFNLYDPAMQISLAINPTDNTTTLRI